MCSSKKVQNIGAAVGHEELVRLRTDAGAWNKELQIFCDYDAERELAVLNAIKHKLECRWGHAELPPTAMAGLDEQQVAGVYHLLWLISANYPGEPAQFQVVERMHTTVLWTHQSGPTTKPDADYFARDN